MNKIDWIKVKLNYCYQSLMDSKWFNIEWLLKNLNWIKIFSLLRNESIWFLSSLFVSEVCWGQQGLGRVCLGLALRSTYTYCTLLDCMYEHSLGLTYLGIKLERIDDWNLVRMSLVFFELREMFNKRNSRRWIRMILA